MAEEKNKDIIDISVIVQTLWSKRKIFLIVWIVTIVLSAIWIFPQPRYYSSDVSLAPETTGENSGGGMASIASSFGLNIGGSSNDAIYPALYPELFTSPQFLVSLLNIPITTIDNRIHCDYYTYLAKYQQPNPFTQPFVDLKNSISQALSSSKNHTESIRSAMNVNSFRMSAFDQSIVSLEKEKIKCSIDKKTDVISIIVQDQDPLVSATLADAVREHLQGFITEYRTHKTRIDVQHYQELADSANLEYRSAVNVYAQFCDANQDITLQSQMSKRDELENDMQMKYTTYQALSKQLESMKVKLQERTPAFTTLKSATVPVSPAGPKRLAFILAMLIVITLILTGWYTRFELKKLFL